MVRKRKPGSYTIGAVAEMYGIHQQTLRLYEREGLLKPSRSDGNTRLYSDDDVQRPRRVFLFDRRRARTPRSSRYSRADGDLFPDAPRHARTVHVRGHASVLVFCGLAVAGDLFTRIFVRGSCVA